MSLYWKCSKLSLRLDRPLIMGVLNLTPDSFSDGGMHTDFEEACNWAYRMLDEGADIIDIGGESTRPGSVEVSAEEELARILPVIDELSGSGAVLSVDTRHPEVARVALEHGCHIINDVSGFRTAGMRQLAAETQAGLIVMHMKGVPATMQEEAQYEHAAQEIFSYLRQRAQELEAMGIDPQRIALDPGPGFGKLAEHDRDIQVSLSDLVSYGYPVVEAVSRKRFVGEISGIAQPRQRDIASIALSLFACYQGVHIVRVHQVKAMYEALCASPQFFTQTKDAYIALGSNQGDSSYYFEYAISALDKLALTRVVKRSAYYKSEAAYYSEQPCFMNAVVKLETSLPALVLLGHLQNIELECKRERSIPNGPRTLDLDLVCYGEEIHGGPKLRLPHPRFMERDFVVEPLLEVADRAYIERILAQANLKALYPKSERVGKLLGVWESAG